METPLFVELVAEVKEAQEELASCQTFIKKKIGEISKKLQEYITHRWETTFPGVKVDFLTGLEGGCFTNKWEAEVYFYTIDDAEFFENKWYKMDEEFKTAAKVIPPIPTARLKRFLKQLSQETGVNCKLVQSSFLRRMEKKEDGSYTFEPQFEDDDE